MNHKPETPNQKPAGEHLQYLLTAYLFDNISPAGRREVEKHLESCALCREALDDLRGTLGDLEDALDDGGREYVFEERRRMRVLEAARQRKSFITKLSFNWKFGAVAALLMVVVTVAMVIPTMFRSRMAANESVRGEYAYTVTTAAPAESAPPQSSSFNREDYDAKTTEIVVNENISDGTVKSATGSGRGPAPEKSESYGFAANPDTISGLDRSNEVRTVTISPPTESKSAGDSPKLQVQGMYQPHMPKPAPPESRDVVMNFVAPEAPANRPAKTEPSKPSGPAAAVAQPNYRYPAAGKPAPKQSQNAPPPPATVLAPVGETDILRSRVADSTSKEASDIVMPPDVLEKAELADHFETINPDRPDNKSAFGNPDGNMFHEFRDKDTAGGGGTAGLSMDDVVGVGGNTTGIFPVGGGTGVSPGTGGGWGGGTGAGADNGKGKGTFGNSDGGRKVIVKRHGGVPPKEVNAPVATTPAAPAPSGALEVEEKSLQAEVNKEESGRREFAIAAKDAEIRVQEELIAKERAEKEKLAVMNGALAEQNGYLAQKGNEESNRQKFGKLAEEAKKKLDNDIVDASQSLKEARNVQAGDKPVELGQMGFGINNLNGENNAELDREVRRYTEDLTKLKSTVIQQQQAVVVDREKEAGAREEKLATEQQLNVAKVKELEKKLSDLKIAQQERQAESYKRNFAGDLDLSNGIEVPFNGTNVNTTSLDTRSKPYGNMQYDGLKSTLSQGQSEQSGLKSGKLTIGGLLQVWYSNDGTQNPAVIEQSLRGFQHFSEENAALTLQDFARRPLPVPPPLLTDEGLDEDEFIQRYGTRPFVDAQRDKLSTFAMDVDTSSYTRTRATLNAGQLPDPETVRVEEFVNYFKQPYTVAGDDAFGVFAEGGPSLFGTGNELEMLKVGIKSRDPRPDERKPAVLTFVIDSSGSMGKGDRLELVQHALKSLVNSLRPEDAVSIVAFGEQGELVLPRTLARQKQHILDAIETLSPRGGTNVESGLSLGYRMADEAFSAEAVNRVILCSDGVANVGAKGPDEILKLVKVFAGRGIDLCTVGFGMGQYNDKMMQRLANEGNGSSYFVDNKNEAARVFSEQLPPNLDVLARDAKVQVEFNPEVIERYRLLGYEKRKIADKDFRNDKIDAGEVGHSTLVTALYEIKRKPGSHGALGKVFLRWKDAGYRHLPVIERNYPLPEGILASSASQTNPNLRFLACVAEFAELLRNSRWARDGSYAAVLQQLRQLPPSIQSTQQWTEVVNLVTAAQRLSIQKWITEANGR